MEENKTTLITGGSGMIGSQFNHPESMYLSSKHGDFRKRKKVNHIFDLYTPSYVIHTAAKVGGIGANMSKQAEFMYDNIMMNTNVIEACRKYGVERACFFLSTCIFPDKVEYPLTEDKIHLGPSHPSNYGYSEAKRAMEVMVRAYNEQYGTKYFCVIPCNVYGPGDNFSLTEGHVIPMLIHKCYLARENNTDLEVWGDGRALREFIYSKDLAKITEKILYETDFTGNIIISNPEEYSIKQLVNNIVTLMKFEGNVKWLNDKPNGQFRKPSRIWKLQEVLDENYYDGNKVDDTKLTCLWDGLTETIQWFEQNYPNIRK